MRIMPKLLALTRHSVTVESFLFFPFGASECPVVATLCSTVTALALGNHIAEEPDVGVTLFSF